MTHENPVTRVKTARALTSLSVAAAVAAGALIPLATSAEAGSRHHRGSQAGHFYDGGHAYRHVAPRHYGYGYGYGYRKKRRNNLGPAIALGVGALMLGIIASEHRRGRRY